MSEPHIPFTAAELADPAAAARERSLSLPQLDSPAAPTRLNPAHPDNSIYYNIGSALRGAAKSSPGQLARSVAAVPFNHGPWPGTAAGAAGGGALGYGLGKLIDTFSDEEDSDRPLWGGLLGAASGGLGGHLLGAIREKAAAMTGATGDDASYVLWRVRSDSSLSQQEKQSLIQALGQLDDGDLSDLAGKLRTAIGAGVGLLVAKFLMKAGVGGMLLGALTGGFVGSRMVGPSILGNAQYSGKTDAYGNAYTF